MEIFLENNITSKSCLKKILSVHTTGTKKIDFFDFSCFSTQKVMYRMYKCDHICENKWMTYFFSIKYKTLYIIKKENQKKNRKKIFFHKKNRKKNFSPKKFLEKNRVKKKITILNFKTCGFTSQFEKKV